MPDEVSDKAPACWSRDCGEKRTPTGRWALASAGGASIFERGLVCGMLRGSYGYLSLVAMLYMWPVVIGVDAELLLRTCAGNITSYALIAIMMLVLS